MTQSYKENPESHYQGSVELDSRDRVSICLFKVFKVLPVMIISAAVMFFMARSIVEAQSPGLDNIALTALFFAIGIFSLAFLFRQERYKEVFESELIDSFGFIFASNAWFKDSLSKFHFASPFQSYYGLKYGQRYRVHIVQGSRMIIRLEKIGSLK